MTVPFSEKVRCRIVQSMDADETCSHFSCYTEDAPKRNVDSDERSECQRQGSWADGRA